jgi:hypothetical protein
VLVAVAVTVAAEALKAFLTQALAALDVGPALTIISRDTASIGKALVSGSLVLTVPRPPVILGETISSGVSVCRGEASALLRVARCFGRGAGREESELWRTEHSLFARFYEKRVNSGLDALSFRRLTHALAPTKLAHGVDQRPLLIRCSPFSISRTSGAAHGAVVGIVGVAIVGILLGRHVHPL